jgi:hypothetical protein
MAQYEKIPAYVAATPQEVAAARKQLTKLKANSAFALMQGARRGALQAKFNSGMLLTALEYAEFGDIVPVGFSTKMHAGRNEQDVKRAELQRKARAEFEESERKRLAGPREMTQREAQNCLSPAAYNDWVDNHQFLIARSVL